MGFNDVQSMYDIVVANAEAYLPLFVRPAETLTRAAFRRLCVVEHSAEGSNNYIREEETLYSWEIFLLNVEGLHLTKLFVVQLIARSENYCE